jgi:hypothetical protein
MKKKLINWINGVVDRAIQSEAWQRKQHAEHREQVILERCVAFERIINRRNAEIDRLLDTIHAKEDSFKLANAQAQSFKQKAAELEARIANTLV